MRKTRQTEALKRILEETSRGYGVSFLRLDEMRLRVQKIAQEALGES